MRVTRLYHAGSLQCGDTTNLNASASGHLVRVLRLRPGTDIVLFNGDGYDYHSTMQDNHVKKTQVLINSRNKVNNESGLNISLLQGLSRLDRLETSIQKSVELGVNKIVPVICQRSNVKIPKDKIDKKLDHWRKVVISACEQSGRAVIPEITQPCKLTDLQVATTSDTLNLVLNPLASQVVTTLSPKQAIQIMVGPEGGLTEEEFSFLKQRNFCGIKFGPRILRTETAGPSMISAVQTLWGDMS